MRKTLLQLFSIAVLSLWIFSGCSRKEWEDVYARPEWLAPPIYQQLQAKGRFNQLLGVIDKSGYKNTLSSAGYWTLFAPNDQAFDKYYKAKGIAGLSQIDSVQAQAIVKYLLVYNAFPRERLDDYQSGQGWKPGFAFKRRTAYYTNFYDDVTAAGQTVKAIAGNRNSAIYVTADNNNKYIPYFTDEYFNTKKLSASDYTYFFPSATYTGFNVVDANVLEKDVYAENGVIHEIDNVISPLPSIDQYLRTNPEYSLFRSLFEKYMVQFIANAEATRKYQVLTGKSDQVFVKTYSNLLAFSPNNENYLKLEDNDGQQDGFSMFVPKNDVLQAYINSVILENYTSFDKLPPKIIADLLNAHMWQTTVWPSKFGSTFNYLGEDARFDPKTNIIDKKFLSNGVFYGTNIVQEANVFSTVYARAYLDPNYTIMTKLLDYDLKFVITNPRIKYTIFMMSDKLLRAAGYDYDPAKDEWSYTVGTTRTTGEAMRLRLLRILATSVVPTPKNELDDLSGSGIIETSNGEYLRYAKNTVYSAGVSDKPLNIVGSKGSKNGKVYYVDGILNFTELNIGKHIELLATPAKSEYNNFWQYLKNSTAFNAVTSEIVGTAAGTFYTVFVPNNAAIQAAVNAGLLPGTGTGANKTPNFAPTLEADKNKVASFIYYHVLNKKSLIPDGKESGAVETLLKNNLGDPVNITVLSSVGAMQLTDVANRRSNVVLDQSNNLSNRTVVHLINNYLQY